MKLFHRMIAGVLALLCVASVFVFSPVKTTAESTAENDKVSYKKKVVSIVYDTSGSMELESRRYYARYALQMLVALLNPNDDLTIVPMCNVVGDVAKDKTYEELAESNTIAVDLANPDRDAAVAQVNDEILALERDVDALKLNNGTFGDTAIKVAEQVLLSKGMTEDQTVSSDGLCEYWLLVLTDGMFSDGDPKTSIEGMIDAHPTLQTVYLSLGDSAIDLSYDRDLVGNSSFTGVHVAKSTALLSAMQTIANKISGRYLLSSSAYSVNDDEVSVDLSKTGLSLKTISLVLQNCGAELVGVTYKGVDWMKYVSQESVFIPDSALKLKNGYSAVLSANPYFEGGTLVLKFDKTVEKENISILLEPALTMEVFAEYQDYKGDWHKLESKSDYDNLAPAQKVRVDYVIKELGSDRVVSKNEVDAKATITYSGDGKTYKELDEIVLVLGSHAIGVLVSMLDGAYEMYVPIPVHIKENENFFRVEGEVKQDANNPAAGQAKFTVLFNNFPVGKDALNSDYKEISVKLRDANGNEIALNHTIQADGTIVADFNLPEGIYGEYKITARVVHSDTSKDPRTCELDVLYPPLNISLVPKNNQEMSLSHYKLAHNEDAMTFELLADGKPFEFDGRFITYSVKLGGQDVTKYCSVNGNILSFVPTRESLGDFASQIGTKDLVVSMHFNAFPEIAATASGSVTLVETVYTLSIDGPDSMRFSHHQLSQNTDGFRFVLDAGGYPMSFDDPLLSYQVKLGSKDITADCTITGNVLTYVPSVESFGEYADDEDLKEIVVTVTSAALPGLNLSQTVRVNLGQTLYEILIVEKGERSFDRFALKNSPSYIDFTILRDGIPMPYAELAEAIANKEFSIDCKLFKNVLLPTGYTLTASESLGDGVVRVGVKRDQIGLLATFTGMLITDGDKPLNISFRGVSNEDAFVATTSPIFEYIWRLMVIAAIIYLIIFAILTPGRGRHPRGAMVTFSIYSSSGQPEMTITPVGMRFKDRLIWGRLFPLFGLTKNQPPKDFDYMILQVEKRETEEGSKRQIVSMQPGTEYVCFNNADTVVLTFGDSDVRQRALKNALAQLRSAVATADYSALKNDEIVITNFPDIKIPELIKAFAYAPRTRNRSHAENDKQTDQVEELSSSKYYVFYNTRCANRDASDSDKKPIAILFFVEIDKKGRA